MVAFTLPQAPSVHTIRAWRYCLQTHSSLLQHIDLLVGELLSGLVLRIASCPLYSRRRGLLSSLTGSASFLGYGSRPLWLLVSFQHLSWLLAPPSSAFSDLAHYQKALLLPDVPPLYCFSLSTNHPLCGTEHVLHPQDGEEQGHPLFPYPLRVAWVSQVHPACYMISPHWEQCADLHLQACCH